MNVTGSRSFPKALRVAGRNLNWRSRSQQTLHGLVTPRRNHERRMKSRDFSSTFLVPSLSTRKICPPDRDNNHPAKKFLKTV